MTSISASIEDIRSGLGQGSVIPYLGAGVWQLVANACPVPDTPQALAERLTARVSVPHKLRKNLTGAAQFIENFKHRKTLSTLMTETFQGQAKPTQLHAFIAELGQLPLIVNTWYDDAMRLALAERNNWGEIQGVSQSEHYGQWVHYFSADGALAQAADASLWDTILYHPLGSVAPAGNFIVSDSDYVEVLTEIDIQTPIPDIVQEIRRDRNFLFLGCRFSNQLERTFARQIMKRSSAHHWAIIEGELSRNEQRFLDEQNIIRIDSALAEFLAVM